MAMRISEEHGSYEPNPFLAGVVPTLLINDLSITHGTLRVFCKLSTYADERGNAAPTERQLAQDLGLSRRTVIRAIQALEDAGYLEIHTGEPTGILDSPRQQYTLMRPALRAVVGDTGVTNWVGAANVTNPTEVGDSNVTNSIPGVITPKTSSAVAECHQPPAEMVTAMSPTSSRVSTGRLKLPRSTRSPDRSRLGSNEVRTPPIVPPVGKKNTGVNRIMPPAEKSPKPPKAQRPKAVPASAPPVVEAPKPPSKLAVVIDGLKAAGVEYLGIPGRDGKALKESAAPPELVLETYLAVREGRWHNPWLRTNLSVVNVVNAVTGYSDWKARGCPSEPVSRGRGVAQVSRQNLTPEEWRESFIRNGIEIDPD